MYHTFYNKQFEAITITSREKISEHSLINEENIIIPLAFNTRYTNIFSENLIKILVLVYISNVTLKRFILWIWLNVDIEIICLNYLFHK